jgi:hypothetical protein
MAKTYYKYEKRDKTVDYSSGVKELSEGLMSTVSGLEEKADKFAGEVGEAKKKVEVDFEKKEAEKKAKDKTFDEKYDEAAGDVGSLSMSTQQDYKPVQAVMLELADKASKINLDLKKQYDGGKMTTSDFNIITDNIANQFRMMKQASITTLDMVTRTNKGMKDGTTLPIQHDMLMDVFSSSFSNPNAEIDFDENGNVIQTVTDPNTGKTTTRSIYDIQKLSMQEFDVFDIDAETKSLVDNIGATLENERILNGKSLTTEELLKKQFLQDGTTFSSPMELVDAEINGYNENQLASILQMKMGANYKRSTDGVDFGDDEIIVYEDQGPTKGGQYAAHLTDNQKTVARDFARAQVLARLNPLKKTTTSTTATERKAAEDRDKNIKAAKLDITYLRKIFEAKTPEEVSQVLARYSNQLIDLIPETERTGSEFIRAEAVGTGDNRTINVVFKDKYGTIKSRPAGVEIPDNFQDFVDSGGVLITGNNNLRTLREEAMAEISDPSSLVRGDKGGVYEITVLEENIPAFKSAVTLAKVDSIIEKELDDDSYWITSPYSDMKDTAEQVFAAMGFEDYTISEDGDNILISVEGYDIPAFDTKKNENRDHSKRRGEFKRHLSDIYTALTTGKKVVKNGVKKTLVQLKAENPNMTLEELNKLLNNQ